MKPTAVKLLCVLTCAVALSACKTAGPVIRPDPQPVVLPAMPDKPVPRSATVARQELLQPQTTTPP